MCNAMIKSHHIPYHGQKSDIISYPISRLKKDRILYPISVSNTVFTVILPVNHILALHNWHFSNANQHLIIENQYFSNAERHLGNVDHILALQNWH
jgi:hypothetical protein